MGVRTIQATATTSTAATADLGRLHRARADLGAAIADLREDDVHSRGIAAAAIAQLGGVPDVDAPTVVLSRQFAVLARRARGGLLEDVATAIERAETLTDLAAALTER